MLYLYFLFIFYIFYKSLNIQPEEAIKHSKI